MENDNLYQVKIEFEDGIILMCYTNGPEDHELELLELMYKQYHKEQPDISKYIITDLTKQNNMRASTYNFTHCRLALKALAYAEEYQ